MNQSNLVGNTSDFEHINEPNNVERMRNSYEQRSRNYDEMKSNSDALEVKNDFDFKEEELPPIIKQFLEDDNVISKQDRYPGNRNINLKRLVNENGIENFEKMSYDQRRKFEFFYRKNYREKNWFINSKNRIALKKD